MGVQEFVWTSEHDSKQVDGRTDSVMIFRRFRRGRRRPWYRVSARFPCQPASFIR